MTKSRGIFVPRRPWTEADLDLLRRDYADGRTDLIATALARPIYAVYNKAQSLGLPKSQAFFASANAGRVQRGRQHPSMVASQFSAGLVPWNKGTHFVAGGRSAETQFQSGACRGRAAQLVVPVGSYRVNGDGYLDRKTSDRPGPQTLRWRAVHRLVWEAANGPVPPGHAVVFLPGRHTTDPALITLDALELITRRELLARNTIHRFPKPLADVMRLRGAVNRQINRRTEHDDEDR